MDLSLAEITPFGLEFPAIHYLHALDHVTHAILLIVFSFKLSHSKAGSVD